MRCTFYAPTKRRGPKSSHASAPYSTPSPLAGDDSEVLATCSRSGAPGSGPGFFFDALGDDFVSNPCSKESIGEAIHIRTTLTDTLRRLLPTVSISAILDDCIAAFVQSFFPSAPICHEPTLRKYATDHFADSGLGDQWRLDFVSANPEQQVEAMRSFSLITGLCAAVAVVQAKTFLTTYGPAIAQPFLRASRGMLRVFEDHDLERPAWQSIATRLFHSSALHHGSGRPNLQLHVMGQARLLAQTMRLHDEASLARWSPLDAELLRNNLWLLYAADKSAASLNSRPFMLHDALFDTGLTLREHGSPRIPLLDPCSPRPRWHFEDRILEAFHFARRLRILIADIIYGLRMHHRQFVSENTRKEDVERLSRMYLEFTYFLDDMPPWIKSPDAVVESQDRAASRYQSDAFWLQRAHVVVTFHCMKMVILHQCIEHGLTCVMGLDRNPVALSMREAEAGRDFVQALEGFSLQYLQAIGEPVVR